MQFIYLYDLKANNKTEFNRIKRVFYYRLKKIDHSKISFLTKSVILVPTELERLMDAFFLGFKNNIEVYKVLCESIKEL